MKTFRWNNIPEKYLDRSAIEVTRDTRPNMSKTICDNCERATRGRCPWAQDGKPYPGWTAAETTIKMNRDESVKSFLVKKCPGYVATWEKIRIITKKGKKKDLLVRRIKQKPAQWQDEGVAALTNAIVKSAREEYILFKSHRAQVSAWVRSARYIDNPEKALADWAEAAQIYDKDPTQKERLLLGVTEEEWKKRQEAKQKAKLRTRIIVYNAGTNMAFAECEQCGAEIELTERRPRWCPHCNLIIKEVVEAHD